MALSDHIDKLWLYEFEPGNRLGDSSGNGPELVEVNGPLAFVAGRVGDAVELVAASDQYLSSATGSFPGARTILAWLRDDQANSASTRSYALVFGTGGGEKIIVGPYDGSVRCVFGATTYTLPLTIPPAGQFYVLGAVVPPGATRSDVTVWLWTQAEGLTSAKPSNATAVGSSTGFSLGSDGTTTRDWNGLVDQALVGTVALTEAEILEFINGGAGVTWDDIVNVSPDETAPLLQSATIGTTGNALTLVFNEAVTVGAGGSGGFALDASGGAAAPVYSSGSGTSTLVYSISRAIEQGETVTLDFTQPGNGIEDLAGNDLATFAGFAVANNSGAGGPSISGTLSVHGSGAATSGTMYAANIATDEIAVASVGGDGSFAFAGLSAGTYRVWGEVDVSGSPYTTQARIVEVA